MPNETKSNQRNRGSRDIRELRARHDQLIGLLLQGLTQKAAAEELGLNESQVSVICRSSVFLAEYRRRRAALIEDSDALLSMADKMATAALIEGLRYREWQEIEVPTKNGSKTVRVPPDMNIALSAAREVKRLNRERVLGADAILSRIESLERKARKSNKEDRIINDEPRI